MLGKGQRVEVQGIDHRHLRHFAVGKGCLEVGQVVVGNVVTQDEGCTLGYVFQSRGCLGALALAAAYF